MSGFVVRTTIQLGRDLDMDDAHLGAILKSKNLQDRMLLTEKLEILIRKAQAFKTSSNLPPSSACRLRTSIGKSERPLPKRWKKSGCH
jgi:hypothetical protein